MNYNERLQKLNSEYAEISYDTKSSDEIKELHRICELALDLCEEMQMIPEIKWIPCSERLPEDGIYIVTCDFYGKNIISIMYFSSEKKEWTRDAQIFQVTAWMELPESYKENVDS